MQNQQANTNLSQSFEKTVYDKIIQLRTTREQFQFNQSQNIQLQPVQQQTQFQDTQGQQSNQLNKNEQQQQSQTKKGIEKEEQIINNQKPPNSIIQTKKYLNKSQNPSILGGCLCSKSNCLRMYCSCFKAMIKCTKKCKCCECLNLKKHDDLVKYAQNKIKLIQKYSFEDELTQLEGQMVQKFGCNCSTKCENRYCKCKKYEVRCSSFCNCQNCTNEKIIFKESYLKQPSKGNCRKKHKIQIKINKKDKKNPFTVKFQIFKKNKRTKSKDRSQFNFQQYIINQNFNFDKFILYNNK